MTYFARFCSTHIDSENKNIQDAEKMAKWKDIKPVLNYLPKDVQVCLKSLGRGQL